MANREYPDLPLVTPRSYSSGRPDGPPRIVVVHYTAGSEGPTSAEDGAAYDQRRTDGTSAHYYVDQDSVVQCVYTWDRAHTALYNGNLVGIHYELCGTRQSRDGWMDKASLATIRRAAGQIRRDLARYGIPAVRLTPAQVRSGARGLCGHADVTEAWPQDGGTHTDPGPEFPWDVLLGLLASSDVTDTNGVEPTMILAKTADNPTIVLTDLGTTIPLTDMADVEALTTAHVPLVTVTRHLMAEIMAAPLPRDAGGASMTDEQVARIAQAMAGAGHLTSEQVTAAVASGIRAALAGGA
jgi:hypothetical protein